MSTAFYTWHAVTFVEDDILPLLQGYTNILCSLSTLTSPFPYLIPESPLDWVYLWAVSAGYRMGVLSSGSPHLNLQDIHGAQCLYWYLIQPDLEDTRNYQ